LSLERGYRSTSAWRGKNWEGRRLERKRRRRARAKVLIDEGKRDPR